MQIPQPPEGDCRTAQGYAAEVASVAEASRKKGPSCGSRPRGARRLGQARERGQGAIANLLTQIEGVM